MPYSIFEDTIADMTYREVEAAVERHAPIIVPIGVIEQHGPHLPLGTDAYGACMIARLVRRRLAERAMEILIVPPFYGGSTSSARLSRAASAPVPKPPATY